MPHATPDLSFGDLTPEFMLDALDAAGLRADGRMLQLNSFENRVLQVHLEDERHGVSVGVAKFYRPARWSDAQILEEHQFARELEADDLPIAAPLVLESPFANPSLGLVGEPATLGHWQPEVDADCLLYTSPSPRDS